VAAERTISKGKELAADALEAPVADIEYREGRFTVAGTDLGIDLFAWPAGRPTSASSSIPAPPVGGPDLAQRLPHLRGRDRPRHRRRSQSWPTPRSTTSAASISPTIVRGQIDGGAVQGIGQALCERMVYDASPASCCRASFMDYAMPHADGFRDFKTAFDESIPCLNNPLGVKGVGELGTIGATPAVVNAVVDALASRYACPSGPDAGDVRTGLARPGGRTLRTAAGRTRPLSPAWGDPESGGSRVLHQAAPSKVPPPR
jgi:carbon-monoxide dehydrogenase large subunit